MSKAVVASRAEEVRGLFARLGGNVPVPVLAKEARAEQIFLPEECEAHINHWVEDECRKALKHEDPKTRLPFACPVEAEEKGTAPIWKQLDFLQYEEAEFNLTSRVKALNDDYEKVVSFHQWMLDTFEKAPDIPLLVGKWHPK